MTEIVSVRFRNKGKSYYFDPAGCTIAEGDDLVVETSKGLELAHCVQGNHEAPDECVVQPLRPVVRPATANDLRIAELNRKREQEAFGICRDKIASHGLDMKLVDVECSFEGNKTTFYFTSDGRVDFRELVKDLAGVFRNRIELRQIGVRDEAKMLGGVGICGRPFCCSQFLSDFQPVSTKMAKTQSMSLNPAKISGSCGRLMCCLRYEEDAYEDLMKCVPKSGAFVETPAGYGCVTQVNLLRRTVKVRIDGEGEDVIKSYTADEIAVVPGGRPKNGEKPPEILKSRPRRTEPETETAPESDDYWHAPAMLVTDEQEGEKLPAVSAEAQAVRRQGSRNRRGGRGGRGRQPGGERPAQQQQQQQQRPAAEQSAKPQGSAGHNRGNRRRKPNKPHPPKADGENKG